MRPQPLIALTDVPTSSRWYEELLGCETAHGGEEYERLLRDGTLVLQPLAQPPDPVDAEPPRERMRKDVREFIRRLEAVGLTVEPTPGHYRVLRDGKPLRKANGMPFTLPFSPDTSRSPPTFQSPGFDGDPFSLLALPVKRQVCLCSGRTQHDEAHLPD
jgi:hypothetical protein